MFCETWFIFNVLREKLVLDKIEGLLKLNKIGSHFYFLFFPWGVKNKGTSLKR